MSSAAAPGQHQQHLLHIDNTMEIPLSPYQGVLEVSTIPAAAVQMQQQQQVGVNFPMQAAQRTCRTPLT